MKDTVEKKNPCPVMNAVERTPELCLTSRLSFSMLDFNLRMAHNRLSLMLLIDEMFDSGVL